VDGLLGLASHRLKIYCFNKMNGLVSQSTAIRGVNGLVVLLVLFKV